MEREWLFDEEHRMFRESIRKWVAAEIAPYADEWEEKGEFPLELFRQAGELGFFGGGIPEVYGGVGGDFRYKVVFGEELARCRSGGVGAGLTLHEAIALPIVNAFGTEEQKQRYLVPGLRGEKIGALCVTEPNTGSDVGALQSTRSPGRRRIRDHRLEDVYHQWGDGLISILWRARLNGKSDTEGSAKFSWKREPPGLP